MKKRAKALSDLPENQTNSPHPSSSHQRVARVQQEQIAYSGPIPPPAMLAKYNEVVPDAAERILKMAEGQSSHRQYLEKRVVDSDVLNSRLGVVCGFVVAVSFLIGAVFVALNGHPALGGILGAVDLVALVSIFIYGTKSRREERKENYLRSKQVPR